MKKSKLTQSHDHDVIVSGRRLYAEQNTNTTNDTAVTATPPPSMRNAIVAE